MLLQNLQIVHAFSLCGWLNYFLSLNDFDEEAAGEFLRTLSKGEATVWGLTVVATENRIAEVTGLLAVGENFSSNAAAPRLSFQCLLMDLWKSPSRDAGMYRCLLLIQSILFT